MSIEAMKLALELAREGILIHNSNSPEYKVCVALVKIHETDPRVFGRVSHVYGDHPTSFGLFDDVPLMNKERDDEWEELTQRKDVASMFTDTMFGFPLNGGFYDLWCICWAKAWDKGFHEGRKKIKE